MLVRASFFSARLAAVTAFHPHPFGPYYSPSSIAVRQQHPRTSNRDACRWRKSYCGGLELRSTYSSTPENGGNDDDRNNNNNITRETIEQRTRLWLEQCVIGMNLCPFADRPYREHLVDIIVERSDDDTEVIAAVLAEAGRRRRIPGTTLVVCPNCHANDFHSYLDVVRAVEELLQDCPCEKAKDEGVNDNDDDDDGGGPRLSDYIQVAPFHPQFVFDGSEVGGPDNWTNRSPYPIFHVLREDEVSKAVDRLDGDAGRVWKRNVNLLVDLEHELGRTEFERFMSGNAVKDGDKALTERVASAVRQYRVHGTASDNDDR